MDYTTLANVKAYGDSKTAGGDALIGDLITGYSRMVDTHCKQRFGEEAYTNQSVGGVVDQYGVLTFYPPCPVMGTPSAVALRAGNSPTWTTLDVSTLDIEPYRSGCVARVLGQNFGRVRGQRLRVRLSYTGGWAEEEIPEDFEMAMRRLVWWAIKLREAPISKTATMDFGQVTIPPSGWAKDIKAAFAPYLRPYPD